MVSHGSHSSSPCSWSSTIHSCAFCRCHSLWIGRLVQTKSFGVAGPEYRRSKINEKSFRSIYNSSGFFERKHHFCPQKQNTHTQRNIVIQSNGSGLSQPHTIVCVCFDKLDDADVSLCVIRHKSLFRKIEKMRSPLSLCLSLGRVRYFVATQRSTFISAARRRIVNV